MASRKDITTQERTGLRSQGQGQSEEGAAASMDPAGETDHTTSSSEEDEEGSRYREDLIAPAAPSSTGGPGEELLTMMREFMTAQNRREEGLLAEIRGLRYAAPTPSTVTASSPRIDLPTPVPQRGQWQAPTETFSPIATAIDYNSSPEHPRPGWRHYNEPKLSPFQMGEDIENYLLRFERIAKTWRWPENEWACRLVPLLSGKALKAYTMMDEERAHCYNDLKGALLTKFDISPETYRQRFRSTVVPPGETPTETYHRLKGLYRRWIRPEQHTKEEVGEAIILEQLLRILPPEVRTWVKEHEPEGGLSAAKLALQYLNARRGGPAARSYSAAPRPTLQLPQPRPTRREFSQEPPGNFSSALNQRGPGKDFVCFYCQQPGHKASVCPIRKAKLTCACYAPRPEVEDSEVRLQRYKTVTVNGQQVTALLDSGSFMSLVRQDLVPVNSVDYSRQEDILCVHGDKHPYPTAELTVTIDEQSYLLTVGVVAKLPVAALLGWDLPVLLDLLQENRPVETDTGQRGEVNVTVSCPVITRAQAKAGVQPLPDLHRGLCEGGTQGLRKEEPCAHPFPDFDSSLFDGGTKGPRKSRRQRRFEKQLKSAEPKTKSTLSNEMWAVPDDISVLQRGDTTLKHLFTKVGEAAKGDCVGRERFIVEKDVLYTVDNDHKRLVVPANCRSLVMHLAHTLPWSGHLGRHKTYLRISSCFYWPSMYTDIQKYCATCPTCQKNMHCPQV
ncbi:uncharacterized protein LOC141761195 [Sebastes fasciatus]|uniref:uncharacterized protein LOC141761195 n=1 Tax=Sebastes fasciatus TaxID=394691 RepID=UPI003D9EED92